MFIAMVMVTVIVVTIVQNVKCFIEMENEMVVIVMASELALGLWNTVILT